MQKPKIGLALGSGAARGWAHLGVIAELNKLGIQADIIAGCSIGSVVGAAYAADKVDEITTWAKELSSWEITKMVDFSLHKGGLFHGEKLFKAGAEHIGYQNIEQLPKKFAALATCLESGREVWLQDGDLRAAVRASSAVPGFLSPLYHKHRWLVDGAVVNPVPVSLCRAMGADLIIAVNLNSDNTKLKITQDISQTESKNTEQEENDFWRLLGGSKQFIDNIVNTIKTKQPRPPNALGVMSNALDITQERLTRARLAGDPPEVLISPKLGNVGVMDFHLAEEVMNEGKRAAQLMRPQLEELLR